MDLSLLGFLYIIVAVLLFSIFHELFHFAMAKFLLMNVRIIPKWWGFYVYLEETSGKTWSQLTKKEKLCYNLIAIFPYAFFIPLFFFLLLIAYENSNFLLYSISFSLLIANFVALPMEWMVK